MTDLVMPKDGPPKEAFKAYADQLNEDAAKLVADMEKDRRIAELEAALRRIADPAGWSFVQVDNEASHTLNQQLAEMQRIAAEALRN